MTDGPWLGDACSLVDAFRAGEITPLEALEASLEAIDELKLNAFSFIDADAARKRAANADVSQPFGGVPVGIKELDPVEGWPYTEASLVFKDRKATYTSTWLRAPARGRRQPGRTDDRERVRRAERQHDEDQRRHRQRLEPVADGRRIVRRELASAVSRRTRPDRVRRRRRRIDPHPGRVQRTARHEGHGRTDPAGAEHAHRADDGRARMPRALGARRRALVRRLRRTRRARPVLASRSWTAGNATSARRPSRACAR